LPSRPPLFCYSAKAKKVDQTTFCHFHQRRKETKRKEPRCIILKWVRVAYKRGTFELRRRRRRRRRRRLLLLILSYFEFRVFKQL